MRQWNIITHLNIIKLVSADDTKIWKELENVEKEKQKP